MGENIKPEPPDRQGNLAKLLNFLFNRIALYRDYIIGFVGWFLVNGVLWSALTASVSAPRNGNEFGPFTLGICTLPIGFVVLLVLTYVPKTRKIGWGALAAIFLNLFISLILGLSNNAVCFVPFFIIR